MILLHPLVNITVKKLLAEYSCFFIIRIYYATGSWLRHLIRNVGISALLLATLVIFS